jgi:hypothetical protein
VGQEWHTSINRAPAASIASWGSPCKEDARRTAPGLRGPSAPSSGNGRHQGSNPGAYSAYSAFSAHIIGAAPAVYHPVGLAQGLISLISLISLILHISTGTAPSDGAQGLKSLRENLPGPGLSPTHHSFCYTGNKCWVPHLPRFPAEACGVDILHAPFLNERRTRDPL